MFGFELTTYLEDYIEESNNKKLESLKSKLLKKGIFLKEINIGTNYKERKETDRFNYVYKTIEDSEFTIEFKLNIEKLKVRPSELNKFIEKIIKYLLTELNEDLEEENIKPVQNKIV